MASALYTDVKRKEGRSAFWRPAEGLFGLRTWAEAGMTFKVRAILRWTQGLETGAVVVGAHCGHALLSTHTVLTCMLATCNACVSWKLSRACCRDRAGGRCDFLHLIRGIS